MSPPERRVDPATWEAPAPPPDGRDGVRGALGGSRLLDRPEHAALRARLAAFVDAPGPLVLEIGCDHGVVLIESARLHPDVRWLGCELRRGHVERAAAHAPENALLVRLDGRTLLDGVIPPGRLEGVVVLFPSPSHDPRHLLLTPRTRDLIATALSPTGRLHVATDVPGMARWVDGLLADWPEGEALPLAPVLSRRDRVCRRDGIAVWRTTRRRGGASQDPPQRHGGRRGGTEGAVQGVGVGDGAGGFFGEGPSTGVGGSGLGEGGWGG